VYRSTSRQLTVLSLALATIAAPCRAQDTRQAASAAEPAPPVETLVARALAQAPSLAARKARVEAAQFSSRAAGTLPNPMLEFEYRDYNFPSYTIGSDPMSMAGVGVRQNLLSKGRRAAERDVAQAEVATARAEEEAASVDLATAIRLQYARLFALDRERETLQDARQLVSMLEATTSSRYAAGQSDQASVLRVQLEQSRIGQRLVDIARERFAAQATINRLTNDPPSRPIGTVTALPDVALPLPAASAPPPDGQSGERRQAGTAARVERGRRPVLARRVQPDRDLQRGHRTAPAERQQATTAHRGRRADASRLGARPAGRDRRGAGGIGAPRQRVANG
jgi:outer membrane protein TolC